jgi:hypothetical protein
MRSDFGLKEFFLRLTEVVRYDSVPKNPSQPPGIHLE